VPRVYTAHARQRQEFSLAPPHFARSGALREDFPLATGTPAGRSVHQNTAHAKAREPFDFALADALRTP
jgi:hypothetical protein